MKDQVLIYSIIMITNKVLDTDSTDFIRRLVFPINLATILCNRHSVRLIEDAFF